MGMSSHVIGFRDPDEKWKQMKDIYDSCKQANVEPPDEVNKFFNWEPPEKEGIKVNIDEICESYSPYDVTEGFKIEISKLPKNITHICFWNSW